LIEYPYVHNAYIAGYLGYLELEALAGYPESTSIREELNRLLALRATEFEKDTPYTSGTDARALSVARNFMYLVPELGQYLHDAIYSEVQDAVEEYNEVAPYWFVPNFDATYHEGAVQHIYDPWAMLQAKALILQQPGADLVQYLDVPAFQVGDLYYIQNLIAVLDAGLASGISKRGSVTKVSTGDVLTYTLTFSGYTGAITVIDTLPVGLSAPTFMAPQGTDTVPWYNSSSREVIWQDVLATDEEIILSYQVTVTTDRAAALKNTAELSNPDGVRSSGSFTVIANGMRCFLPMVVRHD
jgi:hypothetical protein